jgi:hypothetical protein
MAPATLIHIRQGYRSCWNNLTFSVESDSSQWTLQVEDARHSRTLYRASRPGIRAAQVAAAEFAIFQVLGAASPLQPAQLAAELTWQPYW